MHTLTTVQAMDRIPNNASKTAIVSHQTTVKPPAVMVPAKATPHPIYGTTPIGRDGFTLERQNIHLLNFWHEKAVTATKELVKSRNLEDDDPEYDLLYHCQLAIFEAGFKVKTDSPRDVAKLMQIVERHAASCSDIGAALDLEKLQHLSVQLTEATKPLAPKKKTGALQRGRKLTSFGLIHRYQAFLIQELETIGWHVYGERDYPMMYRPYDDAVNDRCKTPNRRGQSPMFFSSEKLTSRARSVLKSLKIDTERSGDRSTNGPKRTAS